MAPLDEDCRSQHSTNSPTETFKSIHRLEDVCRVRDEADNLRREICILRTRLEEVEDERNFHAAKANELTDCFKTKEDKTDTGLVQKSIILAEMSAKLERLKIEKRSAEEENYKLQKQRDAAMSEMGDLSVVVRSLQSAAYSTDDDSTGGEEVDIVLTPQKALDMTLSNMKAHVEFLEDALQQSFAANKVQKKEIAFLAKENELKDVKIEMLEELFRELNHMRSGSSINDGDEDAPNAARFPGTKARLAARPCIEKSLSVPALNMRERFRTVCNVTESIASAMTESMSESISESRPSSSKASLGGDKTVSPRRSVGLRAKGGPGKMNKIKICFKKAGLEGTYTGPVVQGRPHGVGTIRFSNGDTFLGEMTHGKMSGKGTLYTKSKGIFRGYFENNRFVGETKPTGKPINDREAAEQIVPKLDASSASFAPVRV